MTDKITYYELIPKDAILYEYTKADIEAAVLAERERIAAHFDLMSSREMFGGTVADEIRENEW